MILLDVYGWAFDFVSRGIIKSSTRFRCAAKKGNEVRPEDRKYDVFFPMNFDVWTCVGKRRQWLRGKRYCVGVRSASVDKRMITPRARIHVWDGIGCNSVRTFKILRKTYPQLRTLFYTPNGVDTEIYKPGIPGSNPGDRFQVGWSGAVERGCKRVALARRLKYPVKVLCHRFGKYFRRGISRQPILAFYRSIDTLVCTSSQEGMPNVVLEAAAVGLPVVSTAVGDIPRLISKEWLVPANPPALMVKEMNRKLDLLKSDPELRVQVGRRNREEVIKNWAWNKVVRSYERMFMSRRG